MQIQNLWFFYDRVIYACKSSRQINQQENFFTFKIRFVLIGNVIQNNGSKFGRLIWIHLPLEHLHTHWWLVWYFLYYNACICCKVVKFKYKIFFYDIVYYIHKVCEIIRIFFSTLITTQLFVEINPISFPNILTFKWKDMKDEIYIIYLYDFIKYN